MPFLFFSVIVRFFGAKVSKISETYMSEML